MVLSGKDDAISRNYDLSNLNGSLPGKMLDKAVARMGVAQYNTVRAHLVPLVYRMMCNVGVHMHCDDKGLADHIRAWYIWDRIRTEEVRQWPMKKPPASLDLI